MEPLRGALVQGKFCLIFLLRCSFSRPHSYFNTVGSKEGWTPSTFVSSRSSRRKDDASANKQRAEDFMDEEDLADAEESRRIQTTSSFAGLGSTEDDVRRANTLMGLFRPQGETVGVKLLRRMGWKDGQGIGPKVRRTARLELQCDTSGKADTFLFAPENVPMISFVRKTDHKGLGYAGQAKLTPIGSSTKHNGIGSDEEADEVVDGTAKLGRAKFSLTIGRQKDKTKSRGGIGMGVLNDTGSDDEDPYEMGPRISYNRVMGGDRKKKKAKISNNPSLKTKPTFLPKKSALGKVALGARKCHDGRLPLDGFVLGKAGDPLTSALNPEEKYPPPKIPPGWVSSKVPKDETAVAGFVSTADAAKASTLDPRSRAVLLGEKQLPGKSVFDYMSAASRQRLVELTGRADLPAAGGEIPAGSTRSEEDRYQELLNRIPKLDKEMAVGAISRGTSAGAPYTDDEDKRSRYRAYLEYQAGFRQSPSPKPPRMSNDEWLREFSEFFNCARIFRPMSGLMASRFTTSSSSSKLNSGASGDANDLLSRLPAKPQDPAEEAAKLGMFGPLTRSVADFYPTRLLCKRFNVKPPAHVHPDEDSPAEKPDRQPSSQYDFFGDNTPLQQNYPTLEPVPSSGAASTGAQEAARLLKAEAVDAAVLAAPQVVDSSRNEALEAARAGDEVFKAIFGDSDDDD